MLGDNLCVNNMAEIQYGNKRQKSRVYQLGCFSELLDDGYDLRLKVTGRSMSPFLKTGSVVILSQVPVSKLCIGDIIFCQCNDSSYKLHRLIHRDGDRLITKGDALVSSDVPFKKTDYKGKVGRVEHPFANGVIHRNMNNQSVRIINYLIARYHQFKIYFTCMYIRLKSKPA